MNHMVPEFGTANDDYLTPELPNKSMMGENEDVMELLWNNGQILMQSPNQSQSQNQKTKKTETRAAVTTRNEIKSVIVENETRPSALFMEEDEMASWLHFPVDDNNNNSLLGSYLYNNNNNNNDNNNDSDILYPTPVHDAAVATSAPLLPPPSVKIPSSQPPVPTYKGIEGEVKQPKFTNFGHFSKAGRGRGLELGQPRRGFEVGQPSASKAGPASRLTNIVTPGVEAQESRGSSMSEKPTCLNVKSSRGISGVISSDPSSTRREIETCEISITSSHGTRGSGESAGIEPTTQEPPVPTEDRKRKSRNTDFMEYRNEMKEVEFEYPDEKKQSHGASTSMKRSRAAEVHNLSERKRRDRINDKMKALQDLIPHCNKSDKASMLDEAIEYLKSLQMQVQMMSMGCGMVPMMFPGVQHYVPQMAMGIHRTMVPYPALLQGSSMHNPAAVAAAAAHLGQCFPVPGYNMSPVTAVDPKTSQAANMTAPTMSSFPLNNQNQPRLPSFVDPFQQYLGLQQAQLQVPLSQGIGGTPPIKLSSSTKDAANPDIHQTS